MSAAVSDAATAALAGARSPELDGVPAIELRGISRRMGRDLVLDGLNLEIAAGRVVVLRGGNGAGKTTLLRLLATRLRPNAGSGAVHGFDLVRQADDVRARIGLLSVHGGNYPVLTAAENLRLALDLAGPGGGASADSQIAAALERVDLASAGRKLVRSYSSGMKKRLGVARLLLLDPQLWLLDEPYSALDEAGKHLMDEVITAAKARGRTVLLASHENDRAELPVDAVLTLAGGALRAGP